VGSDVCSWLLDNSNKRTQPIFVIIHSGRVFDCLCDIQVGTFVGKYLDMIFIKL